MITAPNLRELAWLTHGFGTRATRYPPGITTIRQIHSCIVHELPDPMPGTMPGTFVADELEGDALVCRRPGTLIGVRTADCVPVLIVDPISKAVAAIHAGWRGTAGNIVAAAVRMICADGQASPRDLRTAIGPSIGPCCYETGPEVACQFAPGFHSRTTPSGAAHLDLPSANEKQLRDAGVTNIWKAGECTFCGTEPGSEKRRYRYHSFRRDREDAGRMISWLGVK